MIAEGRRRGSPSSGKIDHQTGEFRGTAQGIRLDQDLWHGAWAINKYVEIDMKMKEQALAACEVPSAASSPRTPPWHQPDLLDSWMGVTGIQCGVLVSERDPAPSRSLVFFTLLVIVILRQIWIEIIK